MADKKFQKFVRTSDLVCESVQIVLKRSTPKKFTFKYVILDLRVNKCHFAYYQINLIQSVFLTKMIKTYLEVRLR